MLAGLSCGACSLQREAGAAGADTEAAPQQAAPPSAAAHTQEELPPLLPFNPYEPCGCCPACRQVRRKNHFLEENQPGIQLVSKLANQNSWQVRLSLKHEPTRWVQCLSEGKTCCRAGQFWRESLLNAA